MAIDRSKYQDSNMDTDTTFPAKNTQLAVGDSVEGVYVGIKQNVGPNNSNIYVLQAESGERVGVWGSTVIDARMETIAIGTGVAIEYTGLKSPKSGGKPYKDFYVGVTPGSQPVAAGASADRDINDDDIPF